jgi:2'-5' RNA ligase
MSSSPITEPDSVKRHWWWRPGMRPGRRFYTVYVVLEEPGFADLHRLIDQYQAALAPISHVDVIPRPWRHMTVQGIGFTDEVSAADIAGMAETAQQHLAQLPPIELTFRQPAISHTTEAITLSPDNSEQMHAVRTAVRAGIADVWGDDGVPEADTVFRPHASVAYINADGPAQPIRDAIDSVCAEPARALVTSVAIIEMHRDNAMYQWQVRRRLDLAK